MKGTLVVAAREIAERKLLLIGALVAGLIPLGFPLLPVLRGKSADARSVAVLLLAATIAVALPLVFGATILVSDIAHKRLGFYFSRPLPAASIWAGKLLGALFISIGCTFLAAAPVFFVEGESAFSSQTGGLGSWGHLVLAIPGVLLLLLLAHVVASMARLRSAWIVLDFILAVVLIVVIALSLRSLLLAGFWDLGEVRQSPERLAWWLAAALIATLLAASCVQVVDGRTDARRSHGALSATLWGLTAVSAAMLGGLAWWAASARATDRSSSSTPLARSCAWIPRPGSRRFSSAADAKIRRMTTSARREARRVIETEAEAVRGLSAGLDEGFDRAVGAMKATAANSCRVVVTGIGKSGIVGQKIAATLASTGTASFFLHPSEAIHGDLGMILEGDVVLALSHSGETEEVVALIPHVKRRGATLVAMTGRRDSTLGKGADIVVCVVIREEACPLNLAPTASTTAQLVLGDALAMALSVEKGFQPEDFAALHPGGKLGKRFLKVADLMHTGDAIPLVPESAAMKDVVYEMSHKRLGITGVTDQAGRLVGVVSDGDLRRLIERDGPRIMGDTAADAMSRSPKTIVSSAFAAEALRLMEERKITSLFVLDGAGAPAGILHLHDLWGIESI